jgi:hypothetical protein
MSNISSNTVGCWSCNPFDLLANFLRPTLSERASDFNHLSSPHRSNRKIKTVFKTVKFLSASAAIAVGLGSFLTADALNPIVV